MKPEQKATELIEKFGSNSLEVLEDTFVIWNIKRNQALKKLNQGNRSEDVLNALKICDRTLNYWNKVKNIIINKHHGRKINT